MNEELKKYQDLVSGLMQKLDAERQRASRLEHELSQYREGKSLADRLAEKDDIINRQKRTIDKLNAQLDWLKRKVWGRSSDKRPSSYDPAQLTFDFGELSVSPEEEEAYRKAHEELDAYRQQRKDAAEKRRSENRPSRRPIPDSIRREYIDIYPEGYNEEEWELLSDKLCERKVVLHRKPAEYVAIESSSTRQSARTTSRGQSGAQQPRRHQSPRAMRVQPSWPT